MFFCLICRYALLEKEIVYIDGKATRGTEYENGSNFDIVSAYSFHTDLTLAVDIC